MIREEQQKQINKNILIVVEEFLAHGGTMEEIASRTNLTSSSVQRYLNSEKIIELLDNEIYNQVQEKLKENRKIGCSKGGYISTRNNEGIRSEDGRYIGNRKR